MNSTFGEQLLGLKSKRIITNIDLRIKISILYLNVYPASIFAYGGDGEEDHDDDDDGDDGY